MNNFMKIAACAAIAVTINAQAAPTKKVEKTGKADGMRLFRINYAVKLNAES